MSTQPNITTTERRNRSLSLWLIAVLLVFTLQAFAHGGFDHVTGTVVKVASNVLTVKTAKGNVDVKLDGKTELTKGDQKAQLADLTPGVRVVVDVPEEGKDKIAHSVKIGAAGKTAVAHK
jgi:hypothetical protein